MVEPQPACERLEESERKLLLGATAAADEVPVALGVCAVPPRDAVIEVRVGDIPQLLERFEVSIDGRRVDLRMARADTRCDVVCRDVVTRALECVHDQSALDGHPFAARMYAVVELHG